MPKVDMVYASLPFNTSFSNIGCQIMELKFINKNKL